MKSNLYTKHPSTAVSRWMIVTVCFMIMIMNQNVNAQLSGTKNIPGDYGTLAAAIADLNAVGVGAGGVTLNLLAGNPETAPAGGYVIGGAGSLVLTTASSTQTITIQGNGNTITASGAHTGGALNDAIFKLIGADFVTITGFTMTENAANIITAAGTNNMTEWGVALLYVSTTNGCQDVTITGNTIDLDRTYQNTFGIYANATHSATAPTTSATATGATGGNHRLVITSNTITDVNNGICVVGPTAAADHNDVVTIGGSVGTANTITNYGTTGTFSGYANVSGTVNGILVRNSKNFTISFNSVTSSVGGVTAGTLRGIFVPAFSNAPTGTFSNAINNNSISVRSGNTTGTMNGIAHEGTSGTATSSLSISNNDFHTSTHTVASSGGIIFITCTAVIGTTNINNNTFTNLTVNTTGSVTLISNSVTLASGNVDNINNNSIVTGFTRTSAGSFTGISTAGSSVSGVIKSWSGNNISNVVLTGASTFIGINETDGGTVNHNVSGNTISNITGGTNAVTGINSSFGGGGGGSGNLITGNTISNLSGAGAVTGISIGSSGTVSTVQLNTITGLLSTGASAVSGITSSAPTSNAILKNKICNLEANNAGGTVNGILVSAGTLHNISNNIIGDLRTPNANAANPLVGLNVAGGTTVNAYYNTVYLNGSSTGALFGSSAISASTTPTLTLNNNIFVNASSNNGAGLAVSYRRSSTTLTTYSNSSDRNDFFASTLYSDGTTNIAALSAYKSFMVAPRDANSISENPPFISTSCGSANFLHIDLASATGVESGGANVGGITDDFDGHIRFGNGGYAGTGTAPDIGADEFDGTPLPACAALTSAGSISGVAAVCSGQGTTLSLTGSPVASGLSYQWFSGTTMGGPYPTSLGTGLSQATGALTVTTYYIVVVTCANDASTASTAEKEVFVNPLPTVSVSPSSGSYCNPGGTAVALTASGNSTSYSWSPSSGLSATTGSSVNAGPVTSTVYTVTGTLNGCTSTATSSITVLVGVSSPTVTATPSNVCSGGSSTLEATVACLSGAIKITEVTHFQGGTGTTSPYPAYLSVIPNDHVEISNISSSPVDVSGLVYEVWTGTSLLRTVTIPASTVLPGNSVLVIGIGTGTDNPSMFFFHTGGTSDILSSSTAAGHLIRFGASIVDAVAMTSYSWPVASGVTATDWTGAGLAASGRAGVIRTAANDNNDVADWVLSNSPSPLQTIGTYNGGYSFTPCTFTYEWSPSTFLNSTTGSVVTASGATATTAYNVLVTSSNGCTSSGSTTLFVGAALVCSPATFTSPNCANTNFTVTANVSGGGAPYSYSWSDGVGGVYPDAATITANLPAGTYTFTATITDACLSTCNSAVTVTVNPLPPVAVSPTSGLICKPTGAPVTLTASGATSYAWSPSAGLNVATGAVVSANPSSTTTYVVAGTDGNSCVSTASSTITVGVGPISVTAFASPDAVCSGGTSTLTASATQPETVDYYSFMAGSGAALDPMTGATQVINPSNDDTPTGAPAAIGFTFRYNGTDYTQYSVSPDGWILLGGATATSQFTNSFTSTANLPKIFPAWDDFATGTDGYVKVLLSGSSPNQILIFEWFVTIPRNLTGAATSKFQAWLYEGSNNIEFRYGTMTALGTVTSGGGSGLMGSSIANFQSVTFSSNTSSTTTGNNGNSDAPASGTIYTFTPPSGLTYAWEPSAQVTSPGSAVTTTTPLTATTTFTVTASIGLCSLSSTVTVTAGSPLVCADATASSPRCAGSDFTVTANPSGGGAPYSYSWSDGVGGVYPNAETITANLPAGTYTFSCTVTDNCLASCVSSVTVTVNASPSVAINPSSGSRCLPGGAAVQLNASGASTYTWSPSGGLSDTQGSVVLAEPGGTTTYTVTGTDANGCVGTATSTITVASTPVGVSASANPSSICSGGTTTLTAAGVLPSTVDQYFFTAGVGASLDPMTGATQVLNPSNDDTPTGAPAAIGFTFNYNGVDYTQYSVSPDGWILLGGATAVSQFTNSFTSTTNLPKIAAYWDDLATGTDGYVKVLLSGSSPNQILIFEWKVTIPRNTSGASNSTFQAWLYEGSNKIEFRYGTMNTATSTTISGGLLGTSTANFHAITFASNSSSNSAINDGNAGATPASGTIYTYTPPSGLTYSWEPSALVTSPNSAVTATTSLTATTTFTVTVSNGPCSVNGTVQVDVGAALICSPATFTSPNCANTDFTVTANHVGGGGPYSYAWSDGVGGVYPDAQTITANLPAGTYNFTCVVTDDCGASCNSDVTVVVNPAPPVAISPSSGLICMPGGSAVTLTASGAANYSWSPAAGLNVNTGATVEAFPTSTTQYTVTGTDANGCVATATATITRANSPTNVIATANPPSVCFGDFSNLNATSTIPQDYCAIPNTSFGACGSDEWIENVTFNTINNTTTCNVPTGLNDHTNISTNISPGAYTLTALINTPFSSDLLTVYIDFNQDGDFTDLDEEFDATFASPTMTANVVVPATAFNGPTRMRVRLTFSTAPTPCGQSSYGEAEDYTVIISGGVTNPASVTYHWEPAAGLKPNADVQNPETPALPSGTTVYTVTVSNNGCTATATTSVVSGTALVCSAVTTSGPLCSGGFSATANHTGGGAPYSYAWSDGVGGVYPNSQTVTVTLPAGVYTLECTVTDNCGNSCVSSATVTVDHTPAASIAEGSPITACTGNLPYVLNAVTDIGGVSYQWKKDGATISGATSSTLSVSTSGSYSVVISLGACSAESAPSVVTVVTTASAPPVTPTDITVCVGAASSGDFTGSCDQTLTIGGAVGLPFTWTSTLAPSSATLNVSSFTPGSTITDVSVSLDIAHTWGGDLVMSLQAPNGGPTLFITNDASDPNLDYGTPPNGTAPALTYTYNMSGVALPASGDVISPGPYLPFDDFNGFDGFDPNGVWTLTVEDAILGDGGVIDNMQLTITALSPGASWYTTSTGGSPVFTGGTFNPITNGGASTAAPNVYDYYVECGTSSGCPSTRTHVTFTVQSCGGPTLNSCVFVEGFYQGGGTQAARIFTCGASADPMASDNITVAAVECTGSGFVVVDQQSAVMKTDGSFTCTFSAAVITGQPYYLRITHCGTTETWSAAPVVLSAITSYSFCTDPANTFAGNVKPLDATYYGMFSGDVNLDGAVDGSDFLDMDPLIQSGAGCDDCNDLNGDGAVDGSDFLILDPNIQNGIGAALPTCP